MESAERILAIDCGTQSVRCLIFDADTGETVIGSARSIELIHRENAVEVDASMLADVVVQVVREALASCVTPPVGIAITNMRETCVAWSRATGRPAHNAIMWMSPQSRDVVSEWDGNGIGHLIRERTGLSNHAFFFGSKATWLFRHHPELQAAAKRGDLCLGTIDSWLLYVLTGGVVHATDVSNASRYQLLNVRTCEWDDLLLDELGVPRPCLPRVRPTSAEFGVTDQDVVGQVIPVVGMIADQQASLLGHGCLNLGDMKATFGTSGVVGANVGRDLTMSEGLVTSVAWGDETGPTYLMEGSSFSSGYTISWLARLLGIDDVSRFSIEPSSAPADERTMIVPSFTEMGAPSWLRGNGAYAAGLRMDTEARDLVRAGLESMVYQMFDLIQAIPEWLRTDSGVSVDGGGANSDYVCQLLADVSGRRVVRPATRELTALGAACAAARTLGRDPMELRAVVTQYGRSAVFDPGRYTSYANEGFLAWKNTVQRCLS